MDDVKFRIGRSLVTCEPPIKRLIMYLNRDKHFGKILEIVIVLHVYFFIIKMSSFCSPLTTINFYSHLQDDNHVLMEIEFVEPLRNEIDRVLEENVYDEKDLKK